MDADGLGNVGRLSGAAKEFYPIWVILQETGASIQDVEDNWTLERINAFMAVREMKADYKGVWGEYYQQQAARAKEE